MPEGEYVQTAFVTEAFDTTVTDETVAAVRETLAAGVRSLCVELGEDDAVRLLTSDDTLRERDTRRREDPEPATKRLLIEPLFEALAYPALAEEVGDRSEEYGKKADYAASFADHDEIDSRQLLIEAEPINKSLEGSHGLGQVEDWLSYRPFDATFGQATDGLRWVFVTYDADTYALDRLADVDLRPVARAMLADQTGRDVADDGWTDADTDRLLRQFVGGFAFHNVVRAARDARSVIRRRKEAITDEFYDEYVRHVFGITSGDERPRSLVGDGVRAPDAATGDDVRLFAVELLNRLIFVKFLEDRGLVESDLLARFVREHRESDVPRTLYETYLEPLFFGVFDERRGERDDRIEAITLYSEMPYLNGGLFRPTEAYDGVADDRAFDVRDAVLIEIVEMLERYEFSAGGGPDELDPSVLGNVFEKTINYITTDSGDQKKELGAYYTPDEITRFCAERTVQPGLRDALADRLVAEHGWSEASADAADVFALIDKLPPNEALVEDLLGVVDEFRALDPACGSGHFLTSVQSEIVRVRKALYDAAYGALDAEDPRNETPPTWQLRRRTVVCNIYGVDIVQPAVEIAKLRLWLSIIAGVESDAFGDYDDDEFALPNIVFSVQQGNSLIGYTELVETANGDDGDRDTDQVVLDNWGPESVRSRYGDVIEPMRAHEATSDTEEARRYLREAEAKKRDHRPALDEKIHRQFTDAGIDVSLDDVREYDPFHWVLEFAPVYADGGFDVIVGNPPWNRIKSDRDDFFSQYDDRLSKPFRAYRGDAKDEQQQHLLQDEEIADDWESYQRKMEVQSSYFNAIYEMQESKINNRTQSSENDLSSLFLERVFDLAQGDGFISQVLPGRVFHGAPTKRLRRYLLDETTIDSLVSFENHGIFDNIDNRYNFGILTLENSGQTDVLKGIFQHRDLSILENEERLIDIPKEILTSFAPSSLLFPRIQSEEDLGVLRKTFSSPAVGDQTRRWFATPRRPLDKSADSERFYDDPDGCDYPILTGRNFYSYSYDPTFIKDLEPPFQWSVDEDKNPDRSAKRRIREKKLRSLKRAIYDAFDGTGTQTSFVDELLNEHRGQELSAEDVLLPSTTYRLGFRRVARGTDEKSTISAVVPPGPVCDYSFYVIDPFVMNPTEEDLSETPLHGVFDRVFTDRELFVALGLLNSIPFDFIVRRKIDNSIPIYSFKETQIPDLTAGDDWFDYISTRAARLNCYGEAFAAMRERLGGIDPATDRDERDRLRAEIDAAAFHAYGLDRAETDFVLRDFHRVEDPRLMTDAYFDRVRDAYDRLAETGPQP